MGKKHELITEAVKAQCEALIANALKKAFNLKQKPIVQLHFEQNRRADASCAIAFQLAGKLKKSPAEIAEQIARKIKPSGVVASAAALNGFVNFTFSAEYPEKILTEAVDKSYGNQPPTGKVAIVEHSSPNIGKPLHVGHCRSTIYGDVLKRLLQSQGWKVIGSNFLCEAGAQVAKLIVGLRHYGAASVKDENELVDYYVRINGEIESNPKLGEETRSVLEKMEAGEKKITGELKKVRELSVPPIHEIYKQLNVEFDEEIFDSDFVAAGKKVVGEAIKRKIAFSDKNGEVVAQLEKHGLPNLIILRSNATTLYSTRDLGLAESRWKQFKPDLSVIVTGSDQNLHFKQFVKILELLGRPIASRIKHVGYGLVVLPEGKISTRSGRVVLLQDVIDTATQAAEQEILKRQPFIEKEELRQRSKAIGVAALKFAMLKVGSEKSITFDFQKMVSFEGDTGAYLQYSLVRCKSILEKANAKHKKNPRTTAGKRLLFNAEERELLFLLSAFPSVVENASRSLAPQVLCDYLLKTAAAFSKFYSMHSVLEAETEATRKTRLEIVKATGNVLEKGLRILGITPLEKM